MRRTKQDVGMLDFDQSDEKENSSATGGGAKSVVVATFFVLLHYITYSLLKIVSHRWRKLHGEGHRVAGWGIVGSV